ncbi:MAG TPA: sigma-54 dependent transcriptional regulator [Thiobacillaceae bacterium]|nr:sigma-54 dependent transcriptional regulator [Thiobacillaceae bacterium]
MIAIDQLLIIEDDRVLNKLLGNELRRMGFAVEGVGNLAAARDYVAHHEPRLILTDARLPDAQLMDFLPTLTADYPVIVLTAYGSVQEAVSAMKAGAVQYLSKPINLDELELEVKRALRQAALQREHQFCKERLRRDSQRTMVGDSPAIREVQRLIEAVAASDTTVLIQGESGVGKELVARAIHDQSPRASRNFVALDCCTLQEKLFESELFGHEKGAFTGADKLKTGLIEAANGGTLFLDEIGEIDPVIQAKLLRVLETGQYRRLGGVKDLQANTRIVAATNRDLARHSKEGQFRSDLYYRLSAFTLRIPPLRERLQDVPNLVEHFLAKRGFDRNMEKSVRPEALQRLMDYAYPGNIRELRNLVERAVILSGEAREIRSEHFIFESDAPARAGFQLSFDSEPTLDQIERQYLDILNRKYTGHRGRIASALGVSERNIYRLLDKHGLK